MNIILAWKLAKPGQSIMRMKTIFLIKREGASDGISTTVLDALVKDGSPGNRMFDLHVLADDWEIVPEHKKVSYLAGIFLSEVGHLTDGDFTYNGIFIPKNAKITIEWDE